MSDRIVLRGLRLWAHVGVLEHERRLGQWFELDAWFEADLARAGRSDQLADTLDYVAAVTVARQRLIAEVAANVEAILAGRPRHVVNQPEKPGRGSGSAGGR